MYPTSVNWINAVIYTAAAITALGVIWRKIIRPIVRSARVMDQVLPVLMNIGYEFRPNGGTLKEILYRIETNLQHAVETQTHHTEQIAALVAVDVTTALKLDALATKIESIPDKLDGLAANAAAAGVQIAELREETPHRDPNRLHNQRRDDAAE